MTFGIPESLPVCVPFPWWKMAPHETVHLSLESIAQVRKYTSTYRIL
jgi:hypothetical protein